MISFRFKRLIEKLLSFKFVMFVIATILRIFGFIGNGEWLTIAIFVIGGHVGMKTFYKVREGSYDNIQERSGHRREEVPSDILNTPASDIAAEYPSVRGAIDSGIERFRERCQQL